MRLWVLLLLLPGCLQSGADAPEATPPPDAVTVVQPPPLDFDTAIEEVHDHTDPSRHLGHYGMELIGHDPLMSASEAGVLPGGHTEVSIAADDEGRTWAFVANFGPRRAFSITEVTDPAAPRHTADFLPNHPLGLTRVGGGSYWDVAAFPHSDLVVSSAQAMAIIDPTTGAQEEVGGGLYLVNTEDKAAPFTESFTQVVDTDALVPVGIHNARPFWAADAWHVAATSANGNTILFRVEGDAPSRTLVEVSRVVGVHDTTVQVHPFTNQTLLYGASGGVFITDVSDPADPEILSQVPNGPELSAYHLIVPSDVLIEGRHYTVSGTETTEGAPPFITVLDTTEPTSPFIVSTWQTPFDEDLYMPAPYRWATHNFDVDHGRIIMGHYHAGVWIIDISSQTNAYAPVTMAYYQPHEVPLFVPRTPLGTDVPAVWSAVQHDGLIYAGDVNSGLYVLRSTVEPSPLEGAAVFPHNQR